MEGGAPGKLPGAPWEAHRHPGGNRRDAQGGTPGGTREVPRQVPRRRPGKPPWRPRRRLRGRKGSQGGNRGRPGAQQVSRRHMGNLLNLPKRKIGKKPEKPDSTIFQIFLLKRKTREKPEKPDSIEKSIKSGFSCFSGFPIESKKKNRKPESICFSNFSFRKKTAKSSQGGAPWRGAPQGSFLEHHGRRAGT